jgi:hypothetical protein
MMLLLHEESATFGSECGLAIPNSRFASCVITRALEASGKGGGTCRREGKKAVFREVFFFSL